MRPSVITEFAPKRKPRSRAAPSATPRPDPWYKRYPLDYQRGTRKLSIAARGAYSDILDMMYMEGGALPDDDFDIACVLRVKMRVWLRLRAELFAAGKLFSRKGFIVNKRAEEELKERETTRKTKPSRVARVKLFQGKSNEINGRVATEPEAEPESDTEVRKEKPASYDAASLRADDSFISDLKKWHPSRDEAKARKWLNEQIERYGEGIVRDGYEQIKLEFASGKVKNPDSPLGLFRSINKRLYENPPKQKAADSRRAMLAVMQRANGEVA